MSITMKRTYTIPAATLALCLLALVQEAPTQESTAAIRPFHDYVPQAGFSSLRKRIAQTRWPDKGAVSGQTQCAQLTKPQVLAHYWADYGRKAKVKLNAFPKYMTLIEEVNEGHG